MIKKIYITLFYLLLFLSCSSEIKEDKIPDETDNDTSTKTDFFLGADLSYVNEMENCGVTYKNQDGTSQDVFSIFSESGSNIIRVRK